MHAAEDAENQQPRSGLSSANMMGVVLSELHTTTEGHLAYSLYVSYQHIRHAAVVHDTLPTEPSACLRSTCSIKL